MANSTAELIGVIKSQVAAAKALDITASKLRRLMLRDGFPIHADGYDCDAIVEWLGNSAGVEGDSGSEEEPTAATPESITITITLPIGDPRGFIADETLASMRPHVDCRMTNDEQKRGLRHVHQGLVNSHAQFADGRHVDSIGEVVRWIFEQAGLQIVVGQ